MDTLPPGEAVTIAEHGEDPESQSHHRPKVMASAYLLDPDTEGVVRRAFADLGFVDREVMRGTIETAIERLPQLGWPQLLVADISSISEPMHSVNRLAEICDPKTDVILVGERNDIVLYRNLKTAGVAEYFYKPLMLSLLNRTLGNIGRVDRNLQSARGARLVFLIGVRGGVGVTTIATNLAWYLAEECRRQVLLVDLDLNNGDAALQLDAQSSHALREALDDPTRIDDLFLERGVVSVTPTLGLLAGLENLSDKAMPREEAILQLLQKVVPHYRFVLIDLPIETALAFPRLLHLPSNILLVGDGSIAATREIGRWREFLGPNTPDRTVMHVLNKKGAEGALPESEMLRVISPPDLEIRWDRDVMAMNSLGTKAVHRCRTLRHGMATMSLQLTGAPVEEDQHLWKRIFG